MNMEQKQSIAWHVPNLLSICIDSVADGEMSGEIYHCYKKEPLKFSNIIRMIETADKFFDQIKFPQSATQIRSFEKKRTNHGSCTGKGLYTPGSVGKTRCERHIFTECEIPPEFILAGRDSVGGRGFDIFIF